MPPFQPPGGAHALGPPFPRADRPRPRLAGPRPPPPAVPGRTQKRGAAGIVGGPPVVLRRPPNRLYVDALISLSVAPSEREGLLNLLQNSKEVLQCYHVTGEYTFLIKVSCGSMMQLEQLILQFQKLGSTCTQIILSTPVDHGPLDALQL